MGLKIERFDWSLLPRHIEDGDDIREYDSELFHLKLLCSFIMHQFYRDRQTTS
jgi:hypothetical protein